MANESPISNLQSPTSIGAILWDMDGVIVDSGRYHYRAYSRLLGQLGRSLSEDEFFSQLFGRRNWDILRTVLGPLPEDEIKRLAARKEEIFRDIVAGHIEALPGALALLGRAQEAGLKQAIVSSTPRQNVELILRTLGVEALLGAIVGEEDAERGKPAPDGFLVGAQRLGASPNECVVIEDAPDGVAAGKAAGMRCIGVATTRPAERLTQADLVVASLVDERVAAFIFGV